MFIRCFHLLFPFFFFFERLQGWITESDFMAIIDYFVVPRSFHVLFSRCLTNTVASSIEGRQTKALLIHTPISSLVPSTTGLRHKINIQINLCHCNHIFLPVITPSSPHLCPSSGMINNTPTAKSVFEQNFNVCGEYQWFRNTPPTTQCVNNWVSEKGINSTTEKQNECCGLLKSILNANGNN